MDIAVAVKERRSIRKFKPNPVPRELISEIIEKARWSPSWGNTQPWDLYVVSGEPLEKFKKANRERCLADESSKSEIAMPEIWPDILLKRDTLMWEKVFCPLFLLPGKMLVPVINITQTCLTFLVRLVWFWYVLAKASR